METTALLVLVFWVLLSLVRGMLSSWHRAFVGNMRKTFGELLFVPFLVWKGRNGRVFDNKEC